MASNLDYLDPALIPLEEKVKAYLTTEKALRKARETSQPAFSSDQKAEMHRAQARLEQEIVELLPTRDEWVKVNLGYGPSRVGAWLFGLRGPFLQGLALRNLVVRHLAELQLPLDRLSLTFAAPAAVGQTLLLVALGSEVEVHDQAGRLVAFGSSLAH